MFKGLWAFRDAGRVSSFEEAEACLTKFSRTPKRGLPRTEKQWGYHLGMNRNHGVTWVREGSTPNLGRYIAFRLYDTDVVTWYEDNSVEIDNFGTVTTSDFAKAFLPVGVYLSHPTCKRGNEGGHKGIYYRVGGQRTVKHRWGEYQVYCRNLCFGGLVRFRERDGAWHPDESTLDTIKFPELTSRAAARELAKRFHLRDFDNWLSMAPRHMRIEHDCWDVDDCADALEKRDFTLASMFLPLCSNDTSFGRQPDPLPFIMRNRDSCITMGSLRKLKLALWEREGLLETVSFTTIPASEFDRRMRRVRQLDALGMNSDYGPSSW